MKKIVSILICLMMVMFVFSSCGSSESNETSDSPSKAEHTKILFTMENGETFTVETYPEYAPETCENFVKLVNEGFYNGLTFHRIIKDFMAQGGDPKGDGTGGSSHTIKGEFAANGFTQNTLSHDRGIISMARSNDMNSASSQFFICYSGNYKASLDGKYAAFGKVIDGMETIDNFLKIEMGFNPSEGAYSIPTEPIVIKTAEVIK